MNRYHRDLAATITFAVLGVIVAYALTAGFAHAQVVPKVVADPYKADGTEPDACSCAGAGAPPLACSLASVTGGVRPTCDVSPITTPGTYSLTITVTRKEKITNTTGGGSFVPAASATSSPFAFTRGGAALLPPTGAALTTQ